MTRFPRRFLVAVVALGVAAPLLGACAGTSSGGAVPMANASSSVSVGAALPVPSAVAASAAAPVTPADACRVVDRAKADLVGAVTAAAGKSPAATTTAYQQSLIRLAGQYTLAGSVDDAALAEALRAAADAAGALAAVDPFKADNGPFEAAGDRLDELCRKE